MGHLSVALLYWSSLTVISVTSVYTKVCDLQWLSRYGNNVVGGLRNRSSNSDKVKRFVWSREKRERICSESVFRLIGDGAVALGERQPKPQEVTTETRMVPSLRMIGTTHNRGWLKKMDTISYDYIWSTIYGTWIICISFEKEVLNFQISPLERSPNTQPYSSVSWEQNGYYAAQDFLRSWVH
jgi:hypothetical protein